MPRWQKADGCLVLLMEYKAQIQPQFSLRLKLIVLDRSISLSEEYREASTEKVSQVQKLRNVVSFLRTVNLKQVPKH
jgi:hypothetical protein